MNEQGILVKREVGTSLMFSFHPSLLQNCYWAGFSVCVSAFLCCFIINHKSFFFFFFCLTVPFSLKGNKQKLLIFN